MSRDELASHTLLADLTPDASDALVELFRVEQHPVGTALVVEGSDPTKFFLLLDGHVTVHQHGSHLTDLGPGDFFGEVGVLAVARRSATVLATTPVRVGVATGFDLRRLLDQRPELRQLLTDVAAARAACNV